MKNLRIRISHFVAVVCVCAMSFFTVSCDLKENMMKAFDAKRKIPSTIIDQYVEQIIFDKGVFTWILNPALGNQYQRLSIDTSGMKKNQTSPKLLCCADTSTGCY